MGFFRQIEVRTHSKTQFIDVTSQIEKTVKDSGVKSGICTVFVPHTTAGITINENADPSVSRDILMEINKIVPASNCYTHSEGNSPAHIKSTLIGPSLNIIVQEQRLLLGTWQGIYFCEFDGPRHRRLMIKVIEG